MTTKREINVQYVPLKKVIADENQPRKDFDVFKMSSLIASIKRLGIREPLVVEAMPDGTFMIIDGERRFRAATELKLTDVPVIVEKKMSATDRILHQFHLQEQHEGWKPMEKAIAIRDLSEALGVPLQAMGEMLSIHPSMIGHYIKFIQLLANKELVRSDVPIHYAGLIQTCTNKAQRELVRQGESEMEEEQVLAFQVGLINKIISGEIRNGNELTKVRDSLTQDAKYTVAKVIKNDVKLDKIFNETNAKLARLYRQFNNNIYAATRELATMNTLPNMIGYFEEDETAKRNVRKLITELSKLPK